MPQLLNISDALSYLHLTPGMIGVEFGCGSGDFAQTLAKRLRQGRVYAVDIDGQKLSALKSKLDLQKLTNIVTICCDLELPHSTNLIADSCDIVVIPNLLFQSENKHGIMAEAYRILKSDGQCLIIDWLKESPLGPKERIFLPDQARKLAGKLGFLQQKEFGAGDYHYGLILGKSSKKESF